MLSIPHLVIIFLVALVVLGPEKLPQVARMLGKAMADFRRVTTDFRVQIEDEMQEMERQARIKKEAALAEAAVATAIGGPQAENAQPGSGGAPAVTIPRAFSEPGASDEAADESVVETPGETAVGTGVGTADRAEHAGAEPSSQRSSERSSGAGSESGSQLGHSSESTHTAEYTSDPGHTSVPGHTSDPASDLAPTEPDPLEKPADGNFHPA